MLVLVTMQAAFAGKVDCGVDAAVRAADYGHADVRELRAPVKRKGPWLVVATPPDACGASGCLDNTVLLALDPKGCQWRSLFTFGGRLGEVAPGEGMPDLVVHHRDAPDQRWRWDGQDYALDAPAPVATEPRFQFFAEALPADQAAAQCESRGARLARLETPEELEAARAAKAANPEWAPLVAWLDGRRCGENVCWGDDPLAFPYDHAHWIRNGMNAPEGSSLFLLPDGKFSVNPAFAPGGVTGYLCER